MNRVLICEPNPALNNAYREALERIHLWVVCSTDPAATAELAQKQAFHVCLWPVSNVSTLNALFLLKQARPGMAIIAVGETAEPGLVVAAMRAGASNFCRREEGTEGLVTIVSETLSRIVPEPTVAQDFSEIFPNVVGRHPKMIEIFQLVLSLRNSDSTVLITGESGTGKEVVARAIHDVSSRKKQPWVAINCGAIPANLIESELFGHVKGAFTGATQNRLGRFQLAGNGTLFLDEIGDLSFDLQGKLLRALQNRLFEPVGSPQSQMLEARVIAATNQDLESAVTDRRFRQDLFYRLNVIPISIPPLRSRKSDIPLLVRSFLEKFCKQNGRDFVGVSEEAMQCLMQYHWPGNIRELENLMERVVVLKQGRGIIELKDFPVQHFTNVRLDRFVASVALPEDGLDFNEAVNEFENELILQALQRTEGNKNKAATLLNLNRTTLVEKLKRKGLRVTSY